MTSISEVRGTSIPAFRMNAIPQEIQDKIFLELGPFGGFETLEITRELQSNYVKDCTKFNKLVDVTSSNNAKWLLSKGVDPTANNNEAIRMASFKGHTEVVELLLKHPNVDPTANDNEAIRYASCHGHTKIVELLLSIGEHVFDPAVIDNDVIPYASYYNNTEVIKLLSSLSCKEQRIARNHKS